MMTSPIFVNELEDESLRSQFNNLMEAMNNIVTIDPNRDEGAYEALNQRIYQEVTDKPILARIELESNHSLLSAACTNLNLATSHHVIKCLIQAYPSALLVGPSDNYYTYQTIMLIARHPEHCVLMPWIAANHTWVLDHEQCPEVVFNLLDMYSQRRVNSFTSAILKDFFEAYPRALEQERAQERGYTLTVLHYIISSFHLIDQECEVELFKWMIQRCPSSYLLKTDYSGNTPLHLACLLLSKYRGSDSNEICKYLIQMCPGSVRIENTNTSGVSLPIHILQEDCRYRLVREVVVCLLREYPESIDRYWSFNDYSPRSIPFISSIKNHLDEENNLKETVASLQESTPSFNKAVSCTNDQLIRSASTVFGSWANTFVHTTKDKINSIKVKIQDKCNEGLESDE